jgi:hypothetical protein
VELVWYGHVQRMDEERVPQKMLNWIPTGRGKHGRSKTRWKEGVLKSCGRLWSMRRLGQTSLEIGCRKTLPYVIEHMHT